jgi:hypothetical protein
MKLSAYIRDAALVAIIAFLWQTNARLAAIETKLSLVMSGQIQIAKSHE